MDAFGNKNALVTQRRRFYAHISMNIFGNINALMVQRRRCCAFSAQSAINLLIITMFSQKKLNTYGVESPCERCPGVGSFLANPGLSKEQLVPSCVMRVFQLLNTFIGILA